MLRTRQPDYPDARAVIAAAATDVVTVREGSVILALARIGGMPVVLAAQDRHAPPPGPGALRVARRGVRLAADLGLPLVTVIDTTGGELSPQAEQDGLAAQIAHTLSDLLTTPSPTVSVLLGQGTGGAALALLPADRTVAAADGWLAPLAPEGASAIMYRDTDHAADLAEQQGIRAADLAAAGVVDEVVTGPGAGPRSGPGSGPAPCSGPWPSWPGRTPSAGWPPAPAATAAWGNNRGARPHGAARLVSGPAPSLSVTGWTREEP